jgi:hypothetical protein
LDVEEEEEAADVVLAFFNSSPLLWASSPAFTVEALGSV